MCAKLVVCGCAAEDLRSSIHIFDDETGCWQWTHGLTRDESIRLVVYKDSCGQSWAVHELGLGAQLLRNAQAVQTRINSLEDGALPPKTRIVWVAAVGVRVQLARADARPWQLCVRLPIRLRG